jgi:lipopolysaccharide export LptBFGC system permease protein LptF
MNRFGCGVAVVVFAIAAPVICVWISNNPEMGILGMIVFSLGVAYFVTKKI